MTTLKISDEVLKRLGATAADAEAKILVLLTQLEAAGKLAAAAGHPQLLKDVAEGKQEALAGLAQSIAGLPAALQALTDKVEAFDARIKSVEDRKVALLEDDRKAIVAEATTAAGEVAAKQVSAAIAKVGVQGVSAGAKSDDRGDTPAAAADDYVGQYKASKALQAEFSSAETYAAFKKAEVAGRVRISGHRTDFDVKQN